jgi:hypothetical protein
MIETASGSIEFDRQGDTGRNPGSYAEEEAQAHAIANTENHGIRYRAGKQPQRPVLPA